MKPMRKGLRKAMFNLKVRSEDTMGQTYYIANTESRGTTTCKLLSTATAVFLVFSTTVTALAQTSFEGRLDNVSVTDAAGVNLAPTAIINYTQNSDAIIFDATSSLDTDGSIVSYNWHFGDGNTATDAIASHRYEDERPYDVTLTVVDNNGGVTVSQLQYKQISKISTAISFQPAGVPVPSGFLLDSGESFSESRGYGWLSGTNQNQTRDRDNLDSQNQAYDTLISVDTYGKWELILPNGTYLVKIVIGDASWPGGTSFIQAEGNEIFSGQILSTSNRWIEREGTVNVTDGRLTLTFTGSTTSKLNFLEVTK